MSLSLETAGRTDAGRVRERNEDAVRVDDSGRVLVVADGMGGHPGGDRASRIAADTVASRLGSGSRDDAGGDTGDDAGGSAGERMLRAVREANERILEAGEREPRLQGMGTTLTALLVDPEEGGGVVGHVGDSRAYRLPEDGGLIAVTRDHTWVQQRVDAGEVSREQARVHPMSHVLTRAVGLGPDVEVDVEEVEVRTGDLFLLCSDGLVAMLSDAEIERILREGGDDVETLADSLVDEANRRGAVDNVTVAILRAG